MLLLKPRQGPAGLGSAEDSGKVQARRGAKGRNNVQVIQAGTARTANSLNRTATRIEGPDRTAKPPCGGSTPPGASQTGSRTASPFVSAPACSGSVSSQQLRQPTSVSMYVQSSEKRMYSFRVMPGKSTQ
jgi:hypothetical protein